MNLFPIPFTFLLILFFAACTSKQTQEAGEQVTYPGPNLSSLTELMDAIEIVRLQHGDSIITDDRVRLLQRDSSFYLVDILGEKNIYRFARDGRFRNKIGQKGQGPEEFSTLLDIDIEEKGDCVHVLSQPYCTLVCYSKDGTFIERKKSDIPANSFCRSGDGYWVFAGDADRSLLLRLNDSLHITDSMRLTQFPMDKIAYPIPKFSSFGGQAYFWRFPFPVVYNLTADTMQQALFFEFKNQSVPKKDIKDKKSIPDENLTCISKYWENGTYALVEIGRVGKDRKSMQNIYGIKNKTSGQWQWVEYITTPEKPFIPDWYAVRIQDFAQDGRLMCFFFGNEMEELTDEARKLVTNPEELENIDPEMDMFILLCHFKK